MLPLLARYEIPTHNTHTISHGNYERTIFHTKYTNDPHDILLETV